MRRCVSHEKEIEEEDCVTGISVINAIFLHFPARKYHNLMKYIHIEPGPVVQGLDNAIHWIKHYPADSVVCFLNTYPLDSDLSGR